MHTANSDSSLPDIPGGWTQSTVQVGDSQFNLRLPNAPDEFLNDPEVVLANQTSDYMPYWAYLWPAATDMATLVCREEWPSGASALELGAGIGLVGIAAARRGLNVTFSDYDSQAIELAVHNARLNGMTSVRGALLDWRNPGVSGLKKFQVIFGSDVVYEPGNHGPILNVLDQLMSRDGVCWIGDPGRQHIHAFFHLAVKRGYHVQVRNETGNVVSSNLEEPNLPMNHFRLLTLKRSR